MKLGTSNRFWNKSLLSSYYPTTLAYINGTRSASWSFAFDFWRFFFCLYPLNWKYQTCQLLHIKSWYRQDIEAKWRIIICVFNYFVRSFTVMWCTRSLFICGTRKKNLLYIRAFSRALRPFHLRTHQSHWLVFRRAQPRSFIFNRLLFSFLCGHFASVT